MGTADTVACAVFLLAGLLQLRSVATTERRVITAAMFVLFALTLALHSPPAYRRFDQVVGVTNLADLVVHLLGLVGIAMLTVLLLHAVDGRGGWRREIGVLATALAVASLLFVVSDTPRETSEFTATYRDQWTIRLYWLLPATYALTCLSRLLVIVHRARRQIERADVRVGLQVAAYGGFAFGCGYIAMKAAQLFVAHGAPTGWLETDQDVSLVLGMLCLAGGLGAPLVGRLSKDVLNGIRTRRALLGLRRLRAQLVRMDLIGNEVAALSSAGSLRADVLGRNPESRLLRRVVEIRDALLLRHGQLSRIADSDMWPSASAQETGSPFDEIDDLLRQGRPARLNLVLEARHLASVRLHPSGRHGVEGVSA